MDKYLLYADDDADDRMLLVDAIGSIAPHYEVKTVPDGYATLKYLKDQTPPYPCLLIVDLNMPGINGKEIIRRLKQDLNYTMFPIVAFTTSANPSDKEECARFGVDLITKPLDMDALEHAAAKLLEYCQ